MSGWTDGRTDGGRFVVIDRLTRLCEIKDG